MAREALSLRALPPGGPFVERLSPDVQNRLNGLSTLLRIRHGEQIYAYGEEAHFIYFISAGLVRIFHLLEGGHRQITRFGIDGDMIGFPLNGRYLNSAEAVSASFVYRLPWQPLRQLMTASAELQNFLLEKIACEFRAGDAHLALLAQQTFHRVVAFLLQMIDCDQIFDSRHLQLNLPMNRFDIADFLGTSAETTGRAMTRLESLGIIRRHGQRRIQILDLDRLRSLQNRAPRYAGAGATASDNKEKPSRSAAGH